MYSLDWTSGVPTSAGIEEMKGFDIQPNSYFMCTETSPRCFVIQQVSGAEVDNTLHDVSNRMDGESVGRLSTDANTLIPDGGSNGGDIDSDAAPPFLFPWWFTDECKRMLQNLPKTSYCEGDMRSKTPEMLSTEELRERLKRQLEYYFSRENLINDRYLRCQMDSDQYVPIKTVATFNKIKQLTNDLSLIVGVLRESTQVQVDSTGEKVRPASKRCTIILREIPESTDENEVKLMFEGCPRKYQSLVYGLNNSWYVTFEDEEATKLAFLHLKNLGKTFDGKPIHARIKAGGPPEASGKSISAMGYMAPSLGEHSRGTNTGHITVHDLPWECDANTSKRSGSASALHLTAPSASGNELGEILGRLGYATKAIFRPFISRGRLHSNAPTLTPSPALSPSPANADELVDGALNVTEDRMLVNSPDSARLSVGAHDANGSSLDIRHDRESPEQTSNANRENRVFNRESASLADSVPLSYVPNFGRQRITDALRITPKGQESPPFYSPGPGFFTASTNPYEAMRFPLLPSSNPYYTDQFSTPIISNIGMAYYAPENVPAEAPKTLSEAAFAQPEGRREGTGRSRCDKPSHSNRSTHSSTAVGYGPSTERPAPRYQQQQHNSNNKLPLLTQTSLDSLEMHQKSGNGSTRVWVPAPSNGRFGGRNGDRHSPSTTHRAPYTAHGAGRQGAHPVVRPHTLRHYTSGDYPSSPLMLASPSADISSAAFTHDTDWHAVPWRTAAPLNLQSQSFRHIDTSQLRPLSDSYSGGLYSRHHTGGDEAATHSSDQHWSHRPHQQREPLLHGVGRSHGKFAGPPQGNPNQRGNGRLDSLRVYPRHRPRAEGGDGRAPTSPAKKRMENKESPPAHYNFEVDFPELGGASKRASYAEPEAHTERKVSAQSSNAEAQPVQFSAIVSAGRFNNPTESSALTDPPPTSQFAEEASETQSVPPSESEGMEKANGQENGSTLPERRSYAQMLRGVNSSIVDGFTKRMQQETGRH